MLSETSTLGGNVTFQISTSINVHNIRVQRETLLLSQRECDSSVMRDCKPQQQQRQQRLKTDNSILSSSVHNKTKQKRVLDGYEQKRILSIRVSSEKKQNENSLVIQNMPQS